MARVAVVCPVPPFAIERVGRLASATVPVNAAVDTLLGVVICAKFVSAKGVENTVEAEKVFAPVIV
jgi:hypothetical protein